MLASKLVGRAKAPRTINVTVRAYSIQANISHTYSLKTTIVVPHRPYKSHTRSFSLFSNSSTPTTPTSPQPASPPPAPTSTVQPVYSQTEDTFSHASRGNIPSHEVLSDAAQVHAGDAAGHAADAAGPAADAVAQATGQLNSSFPPVNWLGEALTWVHHATGMPWWATIMASTVVVRLITFPVMVNVIRNNMQLAKLKPRIDMYTMKARMASTPEARAEATQMIHETMRQGGVNPLKSMMGIFVQAPVFMLFYFTLKNLTENNVDHMDIGGALWFQNLTIPDPYYILSFVTAGTFILALELGAETGQTMAKAAAFMRNALRIMGVIFIPITATFQSGLLVYWSFNSFLSLVQMMILKRPVVKRFLGLPLVSPAAAAAAANNKKVQIPDIIYTSPPGSKDRKAVNNVKK